jgi:CPA2 family monovalent cation:H+ antiporter-2
MMVTPVAQILLLLGATAAAVAVFHWARVPSSLAYLLVGVLLGPHTAGLMIKNEEIHGAAEFGIVFLMFTIGLNLSLPQVHALRHLVLGLGSGQVLLTTLAIGALAWALGLSPAAAFVVGAVFAQSSTAIIGKQLADQGEEHSRHGRLALAMSVFQDVTAVPLIVIVPVLAVPSVRALGESLGWALAKAALAFVLVFFAGRWLLRPIFHAVASRRSAELFTLRLPGRLDAGRNRVSPPSGIHHPAVSGRLARLVLRERGHAVRSLPDGGNLAVGRGRRFGSAGGESGAGGGARARGGNRSGHRLAHRLAGGRRR